MSKIKIYARGGQVNVFNGEVPAATDAAPGLVSVAQVHEEPVAAQNLSSTENRYYSLELNADGKAIVNVPWVDYDETIKALAKRVAALENLHKLGYSFTFTEDALEQSENYQLYINDDRVWDGYGNPKDELVKTWHDVKSIKIIPLYGDCIQFYEGDKEWAHSSSTETKIDVTKNVTITFVTK